MKLAPLRFFLMLSILIAPSIISASESLISSHFRAIDLTGGVYNATDFHGFGGQATVTLVGGLKMGFAVQRSQVKGVERVADVLPLQYDDGVGCWASSVNYWSPAVTYVGRASYAYPLGVKITTFEPTIGYALRLPRELTVNLGASYQWSRVEDQALQSFRGTSYLFAYRERGYSLSFDVSKQYDLKPELALVPGVGVVWSRGRMETNVAGDPEVLTELFGPADATTAERTREAYAVVAGFDVVVTRGIQQIHIGPVVSVGEEANSARLVLGYTLITP